VHHIAQTLSQRIPDSPRFFVRVYLTDELKKFVIGFLVLESRCYEMSRFQGFDANDINRINYERLPNLKQVRSDYVFGDD
jgi:hypothetical protein